MFGALVDFLRDFYQFSAKLANLGAISPNLDDLGKFWWDFEPCSAKLANFGADSTNFWQVWSISIFRHFGATSADAGEISIKYWLPIPQPHFSPKETCDLGPTPAHALVRRRPIDSVLGPTQILPPRIRVGGGLAEALRCLSSRAAWRMWFDQIRGWFGRLQDGSTWSRVGSPNFVVEFDHILPLGVRHAATHFGSKATCSCRSVSPKRLLREPNPTCRAKIGAQSSRLDSLRSRR